MVTRSRVLSAGSYLPARVVTNDELAKTIDTSDEWIRQRTGIRQRYIAAEGELTSDLAIAASRQALENARLTGSGIDCIVLGACTRPYVPAPPPRAACAGAKV
jgi:3-oxoacyl-[acyl-carrier-protein] synthase-3